MLLCPVETFNQDEFIHAPIYKRLSMFVCFFSPPHLTLSGRQTQCPLGEGLGLSLILSTSLSCDEQFGIVFTAILYFHCKGVLYSESVFHDKARAGCGCLCVQPCTILSNRAHCGRLQSRLTV